MNKREHNIELFHETKRLYQEDARLKKRIQASRIKQQFIAGTAPIHFIPEKGPDKARVIVSRKRSFAAAEPYAKKGKRVCVLNFASATNPGGRVTRGSSAQEECLCRCSTLYPCLNTSVMWDAFYTPHRNARNQLYNDDCIYTPEVCVFRADTEDPILLPPRAWWTTNVLTCAAPNLRRKPGNEGNRQATIAAEISEQNLEALLTSRYRRIFSIAAQQKNQVLILGAFGCGAFRNPPQLVAKVFDQVKEEYQSCFETIEFAVYCSAWDAENYSAFLTGIRTDEKRETGIPKPAVASNKGGTP